MQLDSPSPETTRSLAAQLGAAVGPEGGVIALVGPLGAGKTAFVQGLAEGLGLDPRQVVSPTFVIASEYPLPDGRRLAHADLYRVEHEGELEAAGFLDLLVPGTLLVVEWADRLPAALPGDRLEVRLVRSGETRRELYVAATGPTSTRLLEAWRQRLEGRR